MLNEERCPTCHRKKTRTTPQNSRYWALIRKASDQLGQFKAEIWHEYFKRLYLPMREVELPDWSTLLIPISTSKMNIKDWNIYTQKVEVWLAERGVYLEE